MRSTCLSMPAIPVMRRQLGKRAVAMRAPDSASFGVVASGGLWALEGSSSASGSMVLKSGSWVLIVLNSVLVLLTRALCLVFTRRAQR